MEFGDKDVQFPKTTLILPYLPRFFKMATVSGGTEDGKNKTNPASLDYILPTKYEENYNSCQPTSLLSQEKLDRSSPELWPEQIPGVSEFAALASPLPSESSQPEWLKDLDQEDINMLQDFSSLTAAQLLEKVKDLQNLAYQLGLQEAREMTRGKFLNILDRSTHRRRL